MMHSHALDISGFPEEQKLALDLADTYSSDEEEVTVKMQPIASLVDLHDVEDDEDTLVMPAPVVQAKYPGIGLVIALTLGLVMWALPLYAIAKWIIR